MLRIGFRARAGIATVMFLGVLTSLLTVLAPAEATDLPAPTRTITSAGNPIIADGSLYTADAAPLVGDDGRLYVYTGHDEASPTQGSFVMRDYNILATDDPASGVWDVYERAMKPGEVFEWATGNGAYAGHVTIGADGRYYWYAPVQWGVTTVPNRMAIGVAVSDSPVGPWTDALGEPLLTWTDVFGDSTSGQEVIDPHVFTDADGSIYLYWGSWGVARVVELASSMTETVGEISRLSGLDGFFEAPWVFKRGGLYYMAYDWKQGGSECTPSNYQACIGYATATDPMGPWTYQGIVLGGTSATTVHPSIVEFNNRWYATYHTKDAVGGGHFRRSVAIDEVQWDGATILPIEQTLADDPAYRLTDNVALEATPAASYTEQPPMRLGAVNDGFRATTALLPPDQWGNYRGTRSSNESDWVSYQWETPVRVDSVGIQFHRDSNWIRPPASWRLEYLDAQGDWQPVQGATYPTATNEWHEVSFEPVTTSALRATFNGQPNGPYFHSVSVSEWEVYGVGADAVPTIEVVTRPGVSPELPEAVRASFDGIELWAPTNWRKVDPADYAAEGTFTVEGRALGVTAHQAVATVVVDEDAAVAPVRDEAAPVMSIGLSGTQGGDGWYSSDVVARVRAEDAVDYRTAIQAQIGDTAWTSFEDARYADMVVTESGITKVRGRARDAAGNQAKSVVRTVKIDKDDPTATATYDDTDRTVTVTADDALSGLGTLRYRFDGAGDWHPLSLGTPVTAPDDFPHTFTYRVSDVAGNVRTGSVQVPIGENAQLTGNITRYATATASYASPWAPVSGLSDGTADLYEDNQTETGNGWGTWPRVGEQWVRYDWSFDVTTDRIGVWWFADQPDEANAGLIPPRSWVLEYLDADGTTWRPVTLTEGSTYARTSTGFVSVGFEPVTTRALRIVAQSWGTEDGTGSTGIREWQVAAAAEPKPQ
jgi:hypothetical protein